MVNETPFPSERALILGVPAVAVLTGLVWLLGQSLTDVTLLPDQGASWYYWKLPEPTAWTRLSAWFGYAAHQIVSWGLIWWAQTHARRYTRGLKRVNVVALAANLGFIGLHELQTHLFYDGLAQDVSIFSSQGSVVLLLVVVLLMENRRRGLIAGKPMPIPASIGDFVRRYHGFLFSWAIIYTFWYHPMVTTSGHLIGFFYMFLLLIQSSLMFTTAHTNRWWTVSLELMVAVHGTLVAVMNSGPGGAWPKFLFGFLAVFVITQMHGLGLGPTTRWLILGGYLALLIFVYAGRGLSTVHEVLRVPMAEYLVMAVLVLLLWPVAAVWQRRRLSRQPAAVPPVDQARI
ncbi:hypothetical protein FHR83_001881 [Actinoplanes campanulatus]|uniref:Serine active site containing 1-like protein n=1 Tax=Actinoplanes campanulatus TaxID=113559 RepID=A0A7W5AED9_9ACTN|nr:hypothetical protein [Actinoplanes campanulatus]MBB3094229.1 hypothetical protein [Actinoplanes campanulatus]